MIRGKNLLFVIFTNFYCFFTTYSAHVRYPAKVIINTGKPFLNYIYDMKIEGASQKWNLQLAPLDNIWFDDSHMNITENKTKNGLKIDILKSTRMYRDAKSGSVLSVEGKSVTGILDSDNSVIYENKNNYIVKLGENGIKEINNVLSRKYDKNLSIDNKTLNTDSFANISHDNLRNRRTTSPEYEPMVKVMVDDELGAKLGSDYEIYNYLLDFWNDVKVCFYEFDPPIIHVLISFDMEPSMEHPFITKNLERLEGSDIIRDLSQWAESTSIINNLHDIVYVHTNRDLKNNGSSELKALSENGKVCKDSLVVAIGEDMGAEYDGVRTAAREIAYILGANYDKDTNCDPKDGYIMGDQGPKKTFYSFSNCSIKSMSKHLADNWKLCKEKKLKYINRSF